MTPLERIEQDGRIHGINDKRYTPRPLSTYNQEEHNAYMKGYDYGAKSDGGMDWLDDDNFDHYWYAEEEYNNYS